MNAAMTCQLEHCRCCGQPVEGLEPPLHTCAQCVWAEERQRELLETIERECQEMLRRMRWAGVN